MALTAPRALILRALGLGDLLTAVPALRALRRALPGHRLTLALPAPLAPLARLTGAVDDVLPATGLAPLPPSHPCGGPADIAVNLHGSGPRSHRVLRALRPRALWAFGHPEFPELEGPRWDPAEHEVRRWCRLVSWYGCRPDPDDLDLDPPGPPHATPAPGAVVVHPGAAYPARRWPADRYAAVAAALHTAGLDVVVTGGPAETGLAARVTALAGLPPAADLSGRTPILDLAALVATARLVVCGDTGTGHLATAYRTPSVLLFGPVSPALWGPPPRRGEHTVLTAGARSAGDPHAMTPDPGLLRIEAGRVVAAAMESLSITTGRT